MDKTRDTPETKSTSNVVCFPEFQLTNLPEALRLLANRIEFNELQTDRCICIFETKDGATTYTAFGPDSFTHNHAIGSVFKCLLEMSLLKE